MQLGRRLRDSMNHGPKTSNSCEVGASPALIFRRDLVKKGRALCCFSMVVVQHSAKALSTHNLAVTVPDGFRLFDQLIAQPLVVPFRVIVREVGADGSTKRLFAKEDHP